MRTIAVVQAKGGVGKSTISVHLACGLASRGESALLVDLDPACASSRHLGIEPESGRPDLWSVLEGRVEAHEALQQCSHQDGLWVLSAPADVTMSAGSGWGPFRLKVALACLRRKGIAWVVIDTAPGGSRTTTRALAAADDALVVAEPGWLGESTVDEQLRQIEQMRLSMNPGLRLLGIVPNRVSGTNAGTRALESFRGRYDGHMLPAIRESLSISQAPMSGLPVMRTSPRSRAAREMGAMVDAVLERLTGGQAAQRCVRSCQRMFQTSQNPHPAASTKHRIANPG